MSFTTARRRVAGPALLLATLSATALLGLAGCSPPPPPPTVVDLTLTTGPDANPTSSGQGAPVIMRVYQLASPAGFEKAEFFRLLNQDAATLGADIVKRDEYLLPPGSTKSVNLTPAPTVKALGVFAAYRDFRDAAWRGTAQVPANKTTDVTVKADAKGVTVTAAPAKPAN